VRGSQALIGALVESGVQVCFANPGTSEMHFVAALDTVPQMRGVLGLFEGVCTGAADGYGRMAGKPACTLLHLGPGLANGLANLHNARRAGSPVVNVVGDHATFHKRYDAPLESDIESLARPMSTWYRSTRSPSEVASDASAAVAAALGPPFGVATLVLPADVSWSEVPESTGQMFRPEAIGPSAGRLVGAEAVEQIAKILSSGERTALLLGGRAFRAGALRSASRVSVATGAKLLGETFPGRMERGAGLPAVERLAYLGEFAALQLDGISHLVLVDAKSPVTAFAYPGRPSDLVPESCAVHTGAAGGDAVAGALDALAEALGAGSGPYLPAPESRPEVAPGPLTPASAAAVVGALLPEGAIVSDEGITAGLYFSGATEGAPPHDWLCPSGNAIGQGLPVATGAAVACPDRPVIAVQADGSAMYTIQALWTQAREGLDVTTVILDNRSYAILNFELKRVGAEEGGKVAATLLDLSDPDLDFVGLARSMGVPAVRAESSEDLAEAFGRAVSEPGPHLIQAVLEKGGGF